jgi:hypothetical protein
MDRSFEQVRTEVLELDDESQRRLVEEIEHRLAENDESIYAEAYRRLEAHRRGEGATMSAEESFVRGRAMIEEAKRKRT